jgi:hypothetical protein
MGPHQIMHWDFGNSKAKTIDMIIYVMKLNVINFQFLPKSKKINKMEACVHFVGSIIREYLR